jgi:hypothetical protein
LQPFADAIITEFPDGVTMKKVGGSRVRKKEKRRVLERPKKL